MPHTYHCAQCGRLLRVDPARAGQARCGGCKTAVDLKNPPIYADDAGLDALVAQSPVPVLVDFYTDSCGPCRSLAPTLEQLAAAHRGELLVVKVDAARHQRHVAALGVRGVPALFVYRGGQVVQRTEGARPLAALEQWIRPTLG
jgi:thioredoxin 1